MNNAPNAPARPDDAEPQAVRRPPLLIVLCVLLYAESLLMIGVVVLVLTDVLTAEPASMTSAVAILVLALVGALWVITASIAATRMRYWARGTVLTWQIVQLAVAVGSFQGAHPQVGLGLALLVPSVIGIVLVFMPSVVAVTRRS